MAREFGSTSASPRVGGRDRRQRKRPHPPIYSGIAESFSNKNSDYVWSVFLNCKIMLLKLMYGIISGQNFAKGIE